VFGASTRNILSGPGLYALNLSLCKIFRFQEGYSVEIRGGLVS
jgi:hypothetical protein